MIVLLLLNYNFWFLVYCKYFGSLCLILFKVKWLFVGLMFVCVNLSFIVRWILRRFCNILIWFMVDFSFVLFNLSVIWSWNFGVCYGCNSWWCWVLNILIIKWVENFNFMFWLMCMYVLWCFMFGMMIKEFEIWCVDSWDRKYWVRILLNCR